MSDTGFRRLSLGLVFLVEVAFTGCVDREEAGDASGSIMLDAADFCTDEILDDTDEARWGDLMGGCNCALRGECLGGVDDRGVRFFDGLA